MQSGCFVACSVALFSARKSLACKRQKATIRAVCTLINCYSLCPHGCSPFRSDVLVGPFCAVRLFGTNAWYPCPLANVTTDRDRHKAHVLSLLQDNVRETHKEVKQGINMVLTCQNNKIAMYRFQEVAWTCAASQAHWIRTPFADSLCPSAVFSPSMMTRSSCPQGIPHLMGAPKDTLFWEANSERTVPSAYRQGAALGISLVSKRECVVLLKA